MNVYDEVIVAIKGYTEEQIVGWIAAMSFMLLMEGATEKLRDELFNMINICIDIIKEGEYDKGHWIDNHNGTISCDHCHTWFNKDSRYSYMHYCPNCNIKMAESEA